MSDPFGSVEEDSYAPEFTNNVADLKTPTVDDEKFLQMEPEEYSNKSNSSNQREDEFLVDTSSGKSDLDENQVLVDTGFETDLSTAYPVTNNVNDDDVVAKVVDDQFSDKFGVEKQQLSRSSSSNDEQEFHQENLESEKASSAQDVDLLMLSTDDGGNIIKANFGSIDSQQSYSDNNADGDSQNDDNVTSNETTPQYSPTTESSRHVEDLMINKEDDDKYGSSNVSPNADDLLSLEDNDKPTFPPPAEVKEEAIAAEPVPEPDSFTGISSSVADTTTPGSGDGPVKMPKATTISPPTKLLRASSSQGSVFAWMKHLDPKVWDVLLWRDPRVTGAILAAFLFILISLARCSIFSVISYVLLLTLVGTFLFRIGKLVVAKVHKGDDLHPFKDVLETDMLLSEDMAVDFAQTLVQRLNPIIASVRDWTLVKDFVPSLKFGAVLYALTYVGAWFNGLTLVILGVVAAFTLPKVYEVNKSQIDQYVDVGQAKFDDYYQLLQNKVPYLKKQKTQ